MQMSVYLVQDVDKISLYSWADVKNEIEHVEQVLYR